MKIYTAQMGRWRKLKRLGIHFLDTTTKTGIPAFAPGWDIVLGVKSGEITPEQYTEIYHSRMLESQRLHPHEWVAACQHAELAVICFCSGPPKFCHRHLFAKYLKDYAENRGQEVELGGEIM